MNFDHTLLLILCIALACVFEFVNGFHDTANAVATVIYTRTLSPKVAVVWSGLCNFLGVMLGGIVVAVGIVNLLPVDLLTSSQSNLGLVMVLALLLAAIIWNVGTWYFGLPASSSHTLIGAILGVGIAHSLMAGQGFGHGVNWAKASDVGLSLLISPLIGFACAGLLLGVVKKFVARKESQATAATTGEKPPLWVRGILTLTCSGVSFAHGSNDGQKGIGLIMLILIAGFPLKFALNPEISHEQLNAALSATTKIEQALQENRAVPQAAAISFNVIAPAYAAEMVKTPALTKELLKHILEIRKNLQDPLARDPVALRKEIFVTEKQIQTLINNGQLGEAQNLKTQIAVLRKLTDYAPTWVYLCVALALGLGTMIGWKRIVLTIGTKIGNQSMNYSQGMAAEVVAMSTIGLASVAGLPVSTTHVLSSGIAGTMVAEGVGVQRETVRKILLAWILTLPVSMVLAGSLFYLMRLVIGQ